MQNLVEVEKQHSFNFSRIDGKYSTGITTSMETSLSNVPTPPSLSRYARHAYPSSAEVSNSIADASLESMMRRIGLDINEPGSQRGGTSARKVDSSMSSSAAPSAPPITSYGSATASISALSSQKLEEAELESKYNLARVRDDDDFDMDAQADDFDDSLDYDDQPPLDYIPPPQPDDFDDDDSDDDFADNRSSDSFGEDASGMSNPFIEGGTQAGEVYEDDDSLDDPEYQTGEEETLFGVPPAQRLAMEAALAQRRASQANFRMLGGQLLEDTIGIGAQMARAGRVEETPTPWPGGSGGTGR
jgi:DASH complex subunit ASK1